MARYIDADNLIAHLKDEIEGCKKPFGSRANGKGIAYGTELGLKSAISFANTLATADVVPKSEVERCKDCIYFQPDFVLQNGERRPYTEEEIKNGKIVTGDVGINCGSRCERFDYWEENKIPVWFSENDCCSYFKKKYTESEGKG